MTKNKRGKRIIRFTGELTISRAEEMKTVLLESLEAARHIEIDLSSVEEADLACLQLLCSAHRTSKHLGKVLGLGDNIAGPFKQAVRRAGYARSSGCVLDTDNQCMWKEERFRE